MTPQYILERAITTEMVMKKAGEDRSLSPHFTPYQWGLQEGESPYLNPFFPGRLEFSALRCARQSLLDQIEDIRWYSGYAEPGYHSPDKGVLVANWNNLPDVDLEKGGWGVEWEDEWFDCGDCGKLVRHSADCYIWEPHFVLLNECEVVCLDCLKQNGAAEYIRELEDDPTRCVMGALDPADYGYELVDPEEYDYETGWHAGQTDDPKKVLQELHNRGITRVVFQISETSQFYRKWRAYAHPLRKGAKVMRTTHDGDVVGPYNIVAMDRHGYIEIDCPGEDYDRMCDPDELEVVA